VKTTLKKINKQIQRTNSFVLRDEARKIKKIIKNQTVDAEGTLFFRVLRQYKKTMCLSSKTTVSAVELRKFMDKNNIELSKQDIFKYISICLKN
jgi:hypothetical protein